MFDLLAFRSRRFARWATNSAQWLTLFLCVTGLTARGDDPLRSNAATSNKPASVRPPTPLADAAEQADWLAMDSILRSSTDRSSVNHSQADGMTALHWCVWHQRSREVKRLIEAGADVEASNRYGVRPLTLACMQGDGEIGRLLLESGANANSKSDDGETALMLAARSGNAGLVQDLIQRGADVHAKERKGQTALMWATAEGHVDAVRTLIDAGADFRSPLSSGFTPLLFAAREGKTAVAQLLIQRGADVNESLEREKGGSGKSARPGTSPLVMAVENGHFQLAAELLKLGADPNDQRSGFTALHTLTWVRKPNRGDGDDGDPAPIGSGPLTSLQLVRLLKAHGANVNAQLNKGAGGKGQLNRKGATPFLLAAHTEDLPYMQLLIALGADPTIPNTDGCTALMAAAGIGVLAPGEEAGTEDEALACVNYLLELGLPINTVDENGETAMHGAAYKSLPRMVELLSTRGADPKIWNRPNRHGWTPMDIALGHRPGNFKPNEATQSALKNVLR